MTTDRVVVGTPAAFVPWVIVNCEPPRVAIIAATLAGGAVEVPASVTPLGAPAALPPAMTDCPQSTDTDNIRVSAAIRTELDLIGDDACMVIPRLCLFRHVDPCEFRSQGGASIVVQQESIKVAVAVQRRQGQDCQEHHRLHRLNQNR